MKYTERKPVTINAFKFTGEVTDEIRSLGIIEPNPFQLNTGCPSCGKPLTNHGLFGIGSQFQPICPNQYIIVGNGGIQLMSVENFESIYKPFYTDIVDVDSRPVEEVEEIVNEEVN